MANNTAKVFCKCAHEFQDKTYGKNVRIANYLPKKNTLSTTQPVRCTVCNAVHEVKV